MMSPGITRSSCPGVAPRWRLHFCRRGTAVKRLGCEWAGGGAGRRIQGLQGTRKPRSDFEPSSAERRAWVAAGLMGERMFNPGRGTWAVRRPRFPRTGGNRWLGAPRRWRPSMAVGQGLEPRPILGLGANRRVTASHQRRARLQWSTAGGMDRRQDCGAGSACGA